MITNKEVRISVNKTLTRRLIYVVVALTLLAMMIPAMAMPVSAAKPVLTMYAVDPTNTTVLLPDADSGYNIKGTIVEVHSDQNVTWSVSDTNIAQILGGSTPTSVRVVGTDMAGNVSITGVTSTNETNSIEKKWGTLHHTDINIGTTPGAMAGSSYVTWNEDAKAWQAGPVTVTDTIYGTFVNVANPTAMEGAILDWYLLPANVNVDLSTGEWLDHAGIHGIQWRMNQLMAAYQVQLTSFADWKINPVSVDTYTNVSLGNGKNSVSIYAKGEEAVQVICVAHYPSTINTQLPITPEKATWDFFTTESEVVPQVRWAGEKIVLEKYFGPSYEGKYVEFSLENQSVGALEGILEEDDFDAGSVWTEVVNGFASCILVSSDQGVANVVAGLYEKENGTALGNQHFFTVYFLKFESVTIGDVVGKRAAHNAGLWNPGSPNPWNAAADTTTQTLNVSQDALVRARVKGWFTNSNPSVRLVRTVDPANSTLDNPGSATLTLPAGRWILPDDWGKLAGTNWKQSRIHWDIMNTVGGNSVIYNGVSGTEFVGAPADYNTAPNNLGPNRIEVAGGQLGDYYKYVTTGSGTDYKYMPAPAVHVKYPIVGNDDVVGPFSPGLELMTPAGWEIVNAPSWDVNYRPMHTVVPDGYLDWWDAPMPPAKVIYQIQDAGADPNSNEMGYFKAVNKTDIYYVWATNTAWTPFVDDPTDPYDQYIKVYTNPFYQEMIPAHEAIPTFINNGGYDWNSFDNAYGRYEFWEFINQHRYLPIVSTSDPAGHPTCVEVYSDNHGEAMVWLNGNWNLYVAPALNKGTYDLPYNYVTGTTTIQATVDYPYSRLHQAFQSNADVKTWLWGGLILGADTHTYAAPPASDGTATRMVISAGVWYGMNGDIPSEPNYGKTGTYPNEAAASKDKVVWVWVSDRDGLASGVVGSKVVWTISAVVGTGVRISYRTCENANQGISQYNEITKNIFLTNGFLQGTNGGVTDEPTRAHGISYLRAPTTVEKALFNKFWGNGYTDPITHISYNATSTLNGLNPNNFAVAAIDLEDLAASDSWSRCNVNIDVWSNDFDPTIPAPVVPNKYVSYSTNVIFQADDPLDDALRPGDANFDGVVNMGDVTAVERMILGLQTVSANAILNNEGTVDMGTVVKIERTILGLK